MMQTGNHDNWRVSDRYGPDFTDAINMMLLTLPGTPTTYNGEEIGLANGNYTGLIPRDPFANISGNWVTTIIGLFVFVALPPMSTAMVIAGRSVHLTTLFSGQA